MDLKNDPIGQETQSEMINLSNNGVRLEGHDYNAVFNKIYKGIAAQQQINKLADFIMTGIAGEPSQSEGAIDTAIRLLKQMNASEAIFGFISYLTTRTQSITLSSGHNPGNIIPEIKKFIEVNKLPNVREGWEKNLTHPE